MIDPETGAAMEEKQENGRLMPELVGLVKVMIQRQDETNQALLGLAMRQDETNQALLGLVGEVKATNQRLEGLAADVKAGFKAVNERLDRLAHLDALKEEVHRRFARLEAAVFKDAAE